MQRVEHPRGASPRVERRGRPAPGPRLCAAHALVGERVIGASGESLGTISELMLDVARGRIAYAVLGIGGFMGIGERLLAVPWSALKPDSARNCFTLDADQSALDNAPAFDKEHWPAETDAAWHQRLHRHWGSAPYWE